MYQGKFVLTQLTSIVSRYEFDKCVKRYKGNHRIRNLTCWQQFICMMFGQLTNRESIRDIINCLTAYRTKIYHLGIKQVVANSTLTRANESRDWRIWSDFANYLINVARPLYVDDKEFGLELENTAYALDSSTIDLCLNVFKWAKFRKKKAAIKLHTLMDLQGNIPVFISITSGKIHDVNILDDLEYEAGAFYVMDRGYYDFLRLYRIKEACAFFIIRTKKNFKSKRLYSRPKDKTAGIKFDQIIKLTGKKTAIVYPEKLRMIKYFHRENGKTYVFLTNNFEVEATQIAMLYKKRWQIELFFKWIKQHLKIKKFWGHSPNAVKTQIWIAVCTYLLVAILKKKHNLTHSLYEILQILSISPFNKTAIKQLLMNGDILKTEDGDSNQLNLFDL